MTENKDQANKEGNSSDYSLGALNRHWYRRCLDSLNRLMEEMSENPGIEEMDVFCNKVLTGFLTAVTGQSPDLGELQYPADRAYYFPFDSDRVGNFNFTKVFYKLSDMGDHDHDTNFKLYKDSLWSFFPWNDEGLIFKIDQESSVDEQDRTIKFQELVTKRYQKKAGATVAPGRLIFYLPSHWCYPKRAMIS